MDSLVSDRGSHPEDGVASLPVVPVEQSILLLKTLRLVYGSDRPAVSAAQTGLAPIAIRDLIA